jgi:hypothetical protein
VLASGTGINALLEVNRVLASGAGTNSLLEVNPVVPEMRLTPELLKKGKRLILARLKSRAADCWCVRFWDAKHFSR